MRIFRNEFIGLSVNTSKCHILNEEDITVNRDLVDDVESQLLYERRRANAYIGSCQHFFRVLWANEYLLTE